jgi:hypothetical protein
MNEDMLEDNGSSRARCATQPDTSNQVFLQRADGFVPLRRIARQRP